MGRVAALRQMRQKVEEKAIADTQSEHRSIPLCGSVNRQKGQSTCKPIIKEPSGNIYVVEQKYLA